MSEPRNSGEGGGAVIIDDQGTGDPLRVQSKYELKGITMPKPRAKVAGIKPYQIVVYDAGNKPIGAPYPVPAAFTVETNKEYVVGQASANALFLFTSSAFMLENLTTYTYYLKDAGPIEITVNGATIPGGKLLKIEEKL